MPTSPGPDRVPAAAWALLAVLTALNVLNFVDRQLIASLAPLIIDDLGLTRAEIGLLIGFAFVAFYTVVGVGFGVLADRWPRRVLIAAGLAVWSAMTALSGAARNLAGLAGPRLFVGIGEATLTPAALSMLGDAFPPKRLGLASSLYYAGLPLGTALSLTVAGWMAPRFGWRACFYALGAVGLLAVGLLWLVREPARRRPEDPARPAGEGSASVAVQPVGRLVLDVARALVTRPSLALIMAGGAALAYGSAAAMHGVTWLVDERGFSYARATFVSGAMAIGSGLAGNLAGGVFADWCQRRWRRGRVWSLVAMTLACAPFSAGFFLLPPTSPAFYVCWFVSAASTVAYFGPVFAAVQERAPSHVRSSAVGLTLLVINLGGVGPGPWITGAIGDRLSLTAGLLVSVAVAVAGAGLFALAAWREE